MNTILYKNGIRFSEHQYKREDVFEKLIVDNAKTIFGKNTLYVDAKKKIENDAFGGVIPDGFLFDFSDPKNIEFYLIEVELRQHSFYKHIFPQITKFFAFFNNPDSQRKLIEKLYAIFQNDEELKKELRGNIGSKEVFKFITDTIENSQNILLIIDGSKKEIPEIMETYTDTWGKMVKVAILREFKGDDGNESILSLSPDFENIENVDVTDDIKDVSRVKVAYSEDFHLKGVNHNVLNIYSILKTKLNEQISDIQFNPQRHYISLRKKRNFAFIKVRNKKISIVLMLNEEKIREKITHYEIIKLADSVQKFYNGSCAKVEIADIKNIDEVINVLIEIQK